MPTYTKTQLRNLELQAMFAGLTRDRLNKSGHEADVAANKALHDVTQENPRYDKNARTLLQNRKGTAKHRAYWKTLVPAWAPAVRDKLEAQKIPFSVELFASPEVDISGNAPLYDAAGGVPASLFQVAERSGYIRSLGADTLMLEVWPLYHKYFHRGEGKPVPNDIPGGLMTGGYPATAPDGTRVDRSPLTGLASYQAWTDAGRPE